MDILIIVTDDRIGMQKLNYLMNDVNNNIIVLKVSLNNSDNMDEIFSELNNKMDFIRTSLNNGFKIYVMNNNLMDWYLTKKLKQEYSIIKKVFPLEVNMQNIQQPLLGNNIKWIEYEE
ncbi:MAG: hypothetical protein QXW35_05035 [Candidatus Aenigmatarchaeota archaeon]